MTRDEKIKHVSTLATTLGAAALEVGPIPTAAAVSPWVSMAVAILQETEARFPEDKVDIDTLDRINQELQKEKQQAADRTASEVFETVKPPSEPSDKDPEHKPDPAAV